MAHFVMLALSSEDEGGGGGMETLASGDLTTAVANWLAAFAAITYLDRNTEIRDRLVVNYSETSLDATTLFSRFLQNRA